MEGDPRLRHLEELYLSKNSLKTVPELFMASMLSLKILDLSHNQLGEPLATYISHNQLGEPLATYISHNQLGEPLATHTVHTSLTTSWVSA